jgi:hypothetical protein
LFLPCHCLSHVSNSHIIWMAHFPFTHQCRRYCINSKYSLLWQGHLQGTRKIISSKRTFWIFGLSGRQVFHLLKIYCILGLGLRTSYFGVRFGFKLLKQIMVESSTIFFVLETWNICHKEFGTSFRQIIQTFIINYWYIYKLEQIKYNISYTKQNKRKIMVPTKALWQFVSKTIGQWDNWSVDNSSATIRQWSEWKNG